MDDTPSWGQQLAGLPVVDTPCRSGVVDWDIVGRDQLLFLRDAFALGVSPGLQRCSGQWLLFGDSGHAHPVEMGLKLGQICRVVAHRRPGGTGEGDGERRVELKAGPDRRTRLVQSIKLRQGSS